MLNDPIESGFEVDWRGLTHRNRKLHLKQEEQFYGAAREKERLKVLTPEQLEKQMCHIVELVKAKAQSNPVKPASCSAKVEKPISDSEFEIDQDKYQPPTERDPETNV